MDFGGADGIVAPQTKKREEKPLNCQFFCYLRFSCIVPKDPFRDLWTPAFWHNVATVGNIHSRLEQPTHIVPPGEAEAFCSSVNNLADTDTVAATQTPRWRSLRAPAPPWRSFTACTAIRFAQNLYGIPAIGRGVAGATTIGERARSIKVRFTYRSRQDTTPRFYFWGYVRPNRTASKEATQTAIAMTEFRTRLMSSASSTEFE